MKKIDTKKSKTMTPEYDRERETRVLLEDIHKDVKTLAEQHGSIMHKLEEHDQRFDGVDVKMGFMDVRLMRVESELNSVKLAVMDMDRRIEGYQEQNQLILKSHEERLTVLEVVKN